MVEKNIRIMKKNYDFQLSHGIKTFIKTSCINNITLEKKFFAVATFKGL